MQLRNYILPLLVFVAALLFSGVEDAKAADSYQVPNGASMTIDEFTECRQVTNSSGLDIFVPTKTAPEWASFYNNTPTNVTAALCASCSLDGKTVAHGGSDTFYLSTRPCYSSCGAVSQVRNCYNGTLDGSGTYSKAFCPSESCASCSTQTVNWTNSSFTCSASATAGTHNTNRNVADNTAPNIGSASFTCANGSWGQDSGSCGGASCTLPWGGSIAHNASVDAYQTASVACGGDCNTVKQTRTCNNGSLSGSYSNQSCSVSACSSCTLPWGGSIAHNASVTAYSSSSVACGGNCSSVAQTRTCSNGTLSGSYTNQSCSVSSCSSCTLPWGGSIAHNASVTAYSSSSVACGGNCSSVAQTRTCSDGSLSGSYTNQSCSVAGCASCTLDGATTAHNSSRTYYLSSRSCGQACTAIDLSRTCNNGTLSGSSSYNKASCPAQTCSSCTLPWGGSIAHNASVTAYQTSSVTCGNTCNSQSRTCNDGTLSGAYTNQNCTVGSCGCTTSGGVFIADGQCKTLWNNTWGYYGSGAGTGGCSQTCNSGNVCCNSGSLSNTVYKHNSCSTDGMPCCGGVPC